MRFRILGTVEVARGGAVLDLGGPRHRRLLAALLLDAGRVVSAAKLVDALWGDRPPKSASSMLHVRVSELRAALRRDRVRLRTRHGGYALHVEDDELDAAVFERLVATGAGALRAGDARSARTDLRSALRLWTGPALAEFAMEPFARSAAARLEELRVQALEKAIDADLLLGRHRELVAELAEIVAEHPLHERFAAQHMAALYGAGRQAEALRAYHSARRRIVDELGLEPGETLRRIHHAILTGASIVHLRPEGYAAPPRPRMSRRAGARRLPFTAE